MALASAEKSLAAHVDRLWAAERDIKALMLVYAESMGISRHVVKAIVEYDASRIGLVRINGDRKIVMLVWFDGRAQVAINNKLTDAPLTALKSPEMFARWCAEAKQQADRADSELQQKKADIMKAVRETFGDNAAGALEAAVRHK